MIGFVLIFIALVGMFEQVLRPRWRRRRRLDGREQPRRARVSNRDPVARFDFAPQPTYEPGPRLPPQTPLFTPAPTPVWRDVLSPDVREHALLAELRTQPADDAVRMVYADWLEQRGELASAKFVRGETTDDVCTTSDPSWRAIASCGRVVGCGQFKCPARWSQLVPTGDELERDCARCAKHVRYCVTWNDAVAAQRRGELVVLDPTPSPPPREREFPFDVSDSTRRS